MFISKDITINASPQKIWETLTDFKTYPQWNPFIVSISGKLKPRRRLFITLELPGGKKLTFRARVNYLKHAEKLSWVDHKLVVGLLDRHHIFEISPISNHACRFIQSEVILGLLVPFFHKQLKTRAEQQFQSMNQAIKKWVEKQE